MRVEEVSEYKEDASESSIISYEDTKERTTKETNTRRDEPFLEAIKMIKQNEPPLKLNSARSLSHTTFYSPGRDYTKAKMPLKFVINTERLNSANGSYHKEIENKRYPGVSESRLNQDISAMISLGDNLAECRQTADYRNFADEFENEFKANQEEIDRLSQELAERDQKLTNFTSQLENADVDMVLFRNSLLREIGLIQNSLRETNSNVIVLMNDRARMKDQFCFLQMKMKKLKGYSRTFQEDLQVYAYFLS